MSFSFQMVRRFQLGRPLQQNFDPSDSAASEKCDGYVKLWRLSPGQRRTSARRCQRLGRWFLTWNVDCFVAVFLQSLFSWCLTMLMKTHQCVVVFLFVCFIFIVREKCISLETVRGEFRAEILSIVPILSNWNKYKVYIYFTLVEMLRMVIMTRFRFEWSNLTVWKRNYRKIKAVSDLVS